LRTRQCTSAFSLISPAVERGSGVPELNILEAILKSAEVAIGIISQRNKAVVVR
jgi:hypothetical protein